MTMRKRQNKHEFYLNDKENKILNQKIEKAKISKSDYFRLLITDKEIKEKPGEKFYDVVKNLRGMATNLNQLAIVANKTGNINKERYESLEKEIKDLILEIKKHFLN